LGILFLGLGLMISTFSRARVQALVLTLLAWCLAVFVFDLVALGMMVSTKSAGAANEIELVCDATHVNAAADLHSAYDNVTDEPARSAAIDPTPSIGWLALNPVDLFRALNLPEQIAVRVPALTTISTIAGWLLFTLGASLWRLRRADL
jgi:ABC-type transport system involved in multi-copper enzyme maturation permease subunit